MAVKGTSVYVARKILEVYGGTAYLAEIMHKHDPASDEKSYQVAVSNWKSNRRTLSVRMLRVMAEALKKEGWT